MGTWQDVHHISKLGNLVLFCFTRIPVPSFWKPGVAGASLQVTMESQFVVYMVLHTRPILSCLFSPVGMEPVPFIRMRRAK